MCTVTTNPSLPPMQHKLWNKKNPLTHDLCQTHSYFFFLALKIHIKNTFFIDA